MRLTVYSDLHLEHDNDFYPTNPGSDVLVLSGDICVADTLTRGSGSPYYNAAQEWRKVFTHLANEWDHVLYVPGNHESYHGRHDRTSKILKDQLSEYGIVVLDNDAIEIGGYLFLGTTLWTDGNKNDPITENILRANMNDYHVVQYFDGKYYRKLQPFDTFRFHEQAKDFIKANAPLSDKIVVCGHHAPSAQSIDPYFKDDHYMNGGYFSSLDDLILDHPQIKLFTHGHMHQATDYMIGGTRVVCNPRGYPGQTTGFNSNLVIEL